MGELYNALRGTSYRLIASDLRIRVAPDGLYTYPDLSAFCREPQFADNEKDTLLNPTLIVEVLSPSTEAYDRGFKAAQYRKITSLQEYVLVSQDEARVEVFCRQESGRWLLSEWTGTDATCRFNSIDQSVTLAAIYEGAIWPSSDPPSLRPSPVS
jgi:Uma2 family endonuclease